MLYIIFFLGLALFLTGLKYMDYPEGKKAELEDGNFYRQLEANLSQDKDEDPAVLEDSAAFTYLIHRENSAEEDTFEEISVGGEPEAEEIGKGSGSTITEEVEVQQLYREVYTLSDQGKNGEAIARQLNLGKGEVELILGLRR